MRAPVCVVQAASRFGERRARLGGQYKFLSSYRRFRRCGAIQCHRSLRCAADCAFCALPDHFERVAFGQRPATASTLLCVARFSVSVIRIAEDRERNFASVYMHTAKLGATM